MKRRDGRKRKAKKKRREEGKGKKKGNYRGKITKMAEEGKRKEKRRRKRGGRKGKGRSGRSQRGGAHGGARRWGSGVTPSPGGGGHQQTAPSGDAADPAGRPHGNAERQNPLRYPYGRLRGGRGGGHGARPAQRCGNACRERNHPRCAAPHLPHTAPEIDGYINK